MQTPIDFGKQFILAYFSRKDIDEVLSMLAEDLVWVTPDEIFHLLTKDEIRELIEAEQKKDERQYSVDIASIKSAPAAGDCNTIVYEVNLIPRHEEMSVSLRLSLAIRKVSIGFRIVYVGMSRKYTRLETESIRAFIENIPGGLMVLGYPRPGFLKPMYCNTWISARMGMDESLFFDKLNENPLFMMPYEDQRHVMVAVAQVTLTENPAPIPVKIVLEGENEQIPCQAVVAVVHEGSETSLFITFTEITDLTKDAEAAVRRALAQAQQLQNEAEDNNIDEILDKADEAVRQAVMRAENAIRVAEAAKEEAQAALEKLQTEYEEVQARNKKAEEQYEERILKLEQKLSKIDETNAAQLQAREEELEAEKETALKEVTDRAAQDRKEYEDTIEVMKADAEGNRNGFLARISSMQSEIEQLEKSLDEKEIGLKKMDADTILQLKEKDKCLRRMQHLVSGQMASITGILEAADKISDSEKRQELTDKAERIAESIPDMTEDIIAIAALDPGERGTDEQSFSMLRCIDAVRKVIWPQCRRKGIIFNCETAEELPDDVSGNKAGLQLAFLIILENAVKLTGQGGKLVFHASADPAVKNKIYYRFIITDTGCGEDSNTFAGLFEDPTGELAAARSIITRMGGSILIHKMKENGIQFDIRVNLSVG